MSAPTPKKQLLHLVIGGELSKLDATEFKDLDKVELVGVYPNYATAYAAWRAKAQQTVDNAEMRYFIVHLHRLLDPDDDRRGPGALTGHLSYAVVAADHQVLPGAEGDWGQRRVLPAFCLADDAIDASSRRMRSSGSSNKCRSSWRCGTGSIF